MAVAPTALFINPMFINSRTTVVALTGCILASGTANPFGWEVFQIPSVCKLKENKFITKLGRNKKCPCRLILIEFKIENYQAQKQINKQ